MDIETRKGFLNLAALFQGGTLLLAIALGWLSGVAPERAIDVNLRDFGWGLAAVVPMLGLFFVAKDIRSRVEEMLGNSLSQCSLFDLAALALLAGVGEELLFRGVLQPWIGQWSIWGAIILVNLAFGLAHAITPTYFLFAAGIGVYFSWLFAGLPGIHDGIGSPNLIRPIVAHAVYDFLAFLLLVRDYRKKTPVSDSDTDTQETASPSSQSDESTNEQNAGN